MSASIEKKTFGIISLIVVLIGLFYFVPSRQPVQKVVFIARNTNPFEKMHELTLERLLKPQRWTAPNERLELEVIRSGESKERLAGIYRDLRGRSDVLAVVDNSWGDEISGASEEIRKLKVPVIFLNGDRLGGTDYGDGRLFLGSGSVIPHDVIPLYRAMSGETNHPPDKKGFIFLTEEDYVLEHEFQKVFKSTGTKPNMRIEMKGGPKIGSRAAFQEVTTQLTKYFKEPKSAERKFILINGHNEWGTELIRWIDANMAKAVIIGHQSICSRGPGFTFGSYSNNNELLLFSNSSRAVPSQLFAETRALKLEDPAVFSRHDAEFFVGRCMVAVSLCEKLASYRSWDATLPAERLQKQRQRLLHALRGGTVDTKIGLVRFSDDGEQLGACQVVRYAGGSFVSHKIQINYKREPIEGVEIGIRDLVLRDVDVGTGCFHAEFQFVAKGSREVLSGSLAASLSKEAKDTGQSGTEAFPVESQFSEVKGIALPPVVLTGARTSSVSIAKEGDRDTDEGGCELRHRVSAEFYSDLRPDRFPFDRHQLKLRMGSVKSREKLRISPEGMDLMHEGLRPNLRGWEVKDAYITLGSSAEPLADGTTDVFDTYEVTVEVSRDLWSIVVLVMAPLSLLTIASLSVTFIRVAGGRGEQAAETVKVQTELSLGCVLAVVGYLISYANLTPKSNGPIYSDYLVGATLTICVLNFVFLVLTGYRFGRGLDKLRKYYGIWATTASILFLGLWFGRGLCFS